MGDQRQARRDWFDEFVEEQVADSATRRQRREARLAVSRERAWSGEAGAEHVTPHAGRNLPAAIGAGSVLGLGLVLSLLFLKEAWLAMAVIAVAGGSWEMRDAFTRAGIHVPFVPVIIASPVMLLAAYLTGAHGLAIAFGAVILCAVLWRATEWGQGRIEDLSGAMFIAAYPNLLAGFAALLTAPVDGSARVFVFLSVTVASDIGGYAAGVLFGKHPIAPTVSHKKSWEGFAGSTLACVAVGVATVTMALHGSWQAGALVGLLVAVGATLGDLFESLIKRDLGIKDMSAVIPGHGGFMDRLDSLVITAPIVWGVLSLLVPVGAA